MSMKGASEPKKPGKMTSKPEKGKSKNQGAHILYRIEDGKITRLRPTCERCGAGYFMANHQDRYTCGHCGFTRYKQTGT